MLPDQLGTNEVMKAGASKVSNNHQLRLSMQSDGNLVLYDARANPNKPLWASGTNGKPITQVKMNWDGVLQLLDKNGKVIWSTGTTGHKDSHLIVQNDGNLVMYKDNANDDRSAIWASGSYQFQQASLKGAMGSVYHASSFLSNAVKTVGKPIQVVGEGLQAADGAVTGVLKKIPVLGKPLAAAFEVGFMIQFGPAMLAGDIADGKRIDKAVLDQFKQELQDIKEVAPYVEMVISFVPGIGTGVSAAIAAGLALASGQPITAAIEDATIAAIPGGAVAKAVAEVAKVGVDMAISGKKVTWQALAQAGEKGVSDLLNLPPVAQNAIAGAIDTAGQLAKGVKIDIAIGDGLADTASTYIGKAGANAMKIGVAITHAKFLQGKQAPQLTSVTLKNKMMAAGQAKFHTNQVIAAARANVAPGSVNGFDIGIGFATYSASANDLVTFRASLTPAEQQGFDHAMSLNIGMVANPPPTNLGLTTPKAQAGFYSTMGMQGAATTTKTTMMTNIVKNPVSKVGASVAVSKITAGRMGLLGTFWQWIKHIL